MQEIPFSLAYNNWGINLIIVAATLVAVFGAVIIHYEGLLLLWRILPRLKFIVRTKLLVVIAAILLLHILEIWLFAMIEWFLLSIPECGSVAGQSNIHFFDVVYLSTVTFTTVGYGDLLPVGAIRFIFGTEALTGFVLVTWSASFTYLEMERYWRNYKP